MAKTRLRRVFRGYSKTHSILFTAGRHHFSRESSRRESACFFFSLVVPSRSFLCLRRRRRFRALSHSLLAVSCEKHNTGGVVSTAQCHKRTIVVAHCSGKNDCHNFPSLSCSIFSLFTLATMAIKRENQGRRFSRPNDFFQIIDCATELVNSDLFDVLPVSPAHPNCRTRTLF